MRALSGLGEQVRDAVVEALRRCPASFARLIVSEAAILPATVAAELLPRHRRAELAWMKANDLILPTGDVCWGDILRARRRSGALRRASEDTNAPSAARTRRPPSPKTGAFNDPPRAPL